MHHDDPSKNKLCAAVTITGAVLWLTSPAVTANASAPDRISLFGGTSSIGANDPRQLQTVKPLSQRVEEIREKVRAVFDEGNATDQIQNIVQFYNFLNCARNPTDRRCRR